MGIGMGMGAGMGMTFSGFWRSNKTRGPLAVAAYEHLERRFADDNGCLALEPLHPIFVHEGLLSEAR